MNGRPFALWSLVLTLSSGCEPAPPPPSAPKAAAAPAPIVETDSPQPPEPSAEGPARCATASAKVRFASPEIARLAGIETTEAVLRPLAQTVQATGALAADPRRQALLSSRASGIVRELAKLPGEEAAEGEILAVIESLELGEAKAALRRASALLELREQTWAIEQELAREKVSARRETLIAQAALTEARIEMESARRRLELLGLPAAELAAIEGGQDGGAGLALRAPFAGTILARQAALGETVEPGRAIFALADLSWLQLELDLGEADHALLPPEARLLFTPEGLSGEVFRGQIAARGSAVDTRTRTVRVPARIKNVPRQGRRVLLPGMFGRCEIMLGERQDTLVVPRQAIQWEGCHHVVFVEVREGFYQTRAVELGLAAGEVQEIRAGLAGGERVVTVGSYLLKTEILKGSIGAGCCD